MEYRLGWICGLPVALFVLWFVGSLVRSYLHYRRSPERLWRDRVLNLVEASQRRAQREEAELQRVAVQDARAEASLREQAIEGYFRGISVAELDAYPGIGPATVAKLRDAGFSNLADLHRHNLTDAGLGDKRLADVKQAVRDLARQARSQFDAGACPDAHVLDNRLRALRAAATEQGFRAHARQDAAQQVLNETLPLAHEAQDITFASFLHQASGGRRFSPLLKTVLPDLEAAIRTADERAAREYASRMGQSGKPPVARPVSIMPPEEPKPSQDLFAQMLGHGARSLPSTPPMARLAVAETRVPPQPLPAAPDPRDLQLAALEIDAATPISADLIRRQYNLLFDRFNPEKFEAAGQDFVTLARTKREAVQSAAEALLQSLGEKLEPAPAVPQTSDLRHNPDLDAVFGN